MMSTSRRSFIFVGASFAIGAWSASAAVPTSKMRRIGFLDPVGDEFWEGTTAALRKLGWFLGRNLHVEGRYANGKLESLARLAEELVQAKVELIVTNGPGPTQDVKRATTSIPIVFLASDAVFNGLVPTLSHPGGNATGYSISTSELVSKTLFLLKEARPDVGRVSTIIPGGNPQYRLIRRSFEDSCRSTGLASAQVTIQSADDINAAIAEMVRGDTQALLLVPDGFTLGHSVEIIAAATRAGVVTVGYGAAFAKDGALASYSSNEDEMGARTAYFIDRILRGARPAALPVEQPTKYDLAVNLKTARSLGLAVPRSLILQATDLIH